MFSCKKRVAKIHSYTYKYHIYVGMLYSDILGKETYNVSYLIVKLLIVDRQDINGRAERDLSSPLSQVHLLKVPLA
jgi:hypothetical protein